MCSGLRRRGFGCAGRRICDAAAIHKFCSRWEVARYTARIPHPYPEGSAERFIYAAREANSAGRDLTLVMTPIKGKSDAIGAISLELRGTDRLALGFVLAPEMWGKGLATEAAEADDRRGLRADADGRDPGQRQGRERGLARPCLESAGSRVSARACRARRRAGAWSNATASALPARIGQGRPPRGRAARRPVELARAP